MNGLWRHRPLLVLAGAVTLVGLLAGCGTDAHLYPVNTGPAPWPPPDRPDERIAAADVAPVDEQGQLHFHTHLDIFVDGQEVPVPSSLGYGPNASSSLHTHSSSGILHAETDDEEAVFTLGDVFTLWGVRLTESCAGGYCAPGTPIAAYVDGGLWVGSLDELRLAPYEEIALVIGDPPATIPGEYDCHDAAPVERRSCQGFLGKGE